ncbi:uncharacterized protein [Miscanthus floridulus]|uniref:uncharacterized protein n=1 Tax=Miscanthus floridulus TaxID=154761 RepID=UPI0034575913
MEDDELHLDIQGSSDIIIQLCSTLSRSGWLRNRSNGAISAASPDDLIPGILLRLPPDDTAGLVRASAICKAWRRIISDPASHGHYRALHPTPPVLGFLHRPKDSKLPRFVSTTSFRPAAADHRQHPLDCRHGRALFYDYGSRGTYVVWDPATGERRKVPDALSDDYLPHPTVVCDAGGGCDHRSCSRGPFIVAVVGLEDLPGFGDGDDHYVPFVGAGDDRLQERFA